MLTPVLSQGPQGEAVGCSQGGGIKVPGLSLSRDPMSKAGPAGPAGGPPMPKGHLTLPITSRVVVSFLVHQGSYNRNHRLGAHTTNFFFFFFLTVLEAGNQIETPASSMSGENPLPDYRWLSSRCALTW